MINILKNAIIRRIAYVLVTLLLAFLSDKVFANITAENRWNYYDAGQGTPVFYDSAILACQAFVSNGTGRTYHSVSEPNNVTCSQSLCTTGTIASCVFLHSTTGSTLQYRNLSAYRSPACVSPNVFNFDTKSCGEPIPENLCLIAQGQNIGSVTYYGNSQTGCYAGCEVAFTGLTVCLADDYCTSDVSTITGQQCSPNTPVPQTPEAQCLSQGKTYGTVNGVVVCVPYGSPNSQPVTSTIDGQTTVTSGENVTNTTNNYTDNGSTVTTTSTTITNGGEPAVTTTEQDKNTFCAENPNSKLCSSEKDPCADNPDRIGCQDLGEVPLADEIQEETFGLSNIPTIALPTDESCPAPDTVNIGSVTIPISYQPLCNWADAFKPFIVAFAYISAFLLAYSALRKA